MRTASTLTTYILGSVSPVESEVRDIFSWCPWQGSLESSPTVTTGNIHNGLREATHARMHTHAHTHKPMDLQRSTSFLIGVKMISFY